MAGATEENPAGCGREEVLFCIARAGFSEKGHWSRDPNAVMEWAKQIPGRRPFQKTRTPMSTAVLFPTAQTWKQPRCPSIEEWIKMWCIHIMEYHSAIKKDEITPFVAT